MYEKWITQIIIKETDVILNRVKDYCENDKKRLREQARDNYRNLSEEDENNKRESMEETYHKRNKD